MCAQPPPPPPTACLAVVACACVYMCVCSCSCRSSVPPACMSVRMFSGGAQGCTPHVQRQPCTSRCSTTTAASDSMSQHSETQLPKLDSGFKPLYTLRAHKLAVSSVKYAHASHQRWAYVIHLLLFPARHGSCNSFLGFPPARDFCFLLPPTKHCCYGTL